MATLRHNMTPSERGAPGSLGLVLTPSTPPSSISDQSALSLASDLAEQRRSQAHPEATENATAAPPPPETSRGGALPSLVSMFSAFLTFSSSDQTAASAETAGQSLADPSLSSSLQHSSRRAHLKPASPPLPPFWAASRGAAVTPTEESVTSRGLFVEGVGLVSSDRTPLSRLVSSCAPVCEPSEFGAWPRLESSTSVSLVEPEDIGRGKLSGANIGRALSLNLPRAAGHTAWSNQVTRPTITPSRSFPEDPDEAPKEPADLFRNRSMPTRRPGNRSNKPRPNLTVVTDMARLEQARRAAVTATAADSAGATSSSRPHRLSAPSKPVTSTTYLSFPSSIMGSRRLSAASVGWSGTGATAVSSVGSGSTAVGEKTAPLATPAVGGDRATKDKDSERWEEVFGSSPPASDKPVFTIITTDWTRHQQRSSPLSAATLNSTLPSPGNSPHPQSSRYLLPPAAAPRVGAPAYQLLRSNASRSYPRSPFPREDVSPIATPSPAPSDSVSQCGGPRSADPDSASAPYSPGPWTAAEARVRRARSAGRVACFPGDPSSPRWLSGGTSPVGIEPGFAVEGW